MGTSAFVHIRPRYEDDRSRRCLVEVCRQEADQSAALAMGRRALKNWRTHGFTAAVTDLLDGLAMVAADLRRFEEAAELMGAAEGWRQAYEEVTDFCHRAPFTRGSAGVRSRLGAAGWSAAHTRGTAWAPGQAILRAEELLDQLPTVLGTRPSGLTPREVEVLRLVAQGLSNADIADHLVLSRRTVHAHLRSIFGKLGVSTRTAAASRGVDLLPLVSPHRAHS